MNKKYVMIKGLAFNEKNDMNKLKKYANEGWVLEDVVAGFFYKLKKDKPRDIDYNLDYRIKADEEYFGMFLESGWTRVVSVGNEIHIFSAPEGTKPIYSDNETEIDKYTRMKKEMGKGTIYSLIAMLTFVFVLVVAAIVLRPIFLVVCLLFMVSIIVFVFNFMPYLAYTFQLRKLRKFRENNK